jgi:hypothetical protein
MILIDYLQNKFLVMDRKPSSVYVNNYL